VDHITAWHSTARMAWRSSAHHLTGQAGLVSCCEPAAARVMALPKVEAAQEGCMHHHLGTAHSTAQHGTAHDQLRCDCWSMVGGGIMLLPGAPQCTTRNGQQFWSQVMSQVTCSTLFMKHVLPKLLRPRSPKGSPSDATQSSQVPAAAAASSDAACWSAPAASAAAAPAASAAVWLLELLLGLQPGSGEGAGASFCRLDSRAGPGSLLGMLHCTLCPFRCIHCWHAICSSTRVMLVSSYAGDTQCTVRKMPTCKLAVSETPNG
jgi:hypothetical protein